MKAVAPPFGNPSNLFDATTWVQNYSLLTYLPIWITLISCGVFTAALLVVYYAFFRLLLEQFFLCFGATTAAKSSWRVRFVARYSRTKAPFILMALVTALSAYSCVLFVYSAIQVQVLASPGPILQFFRSPFIIWTEFAVSVIILIDYLFKFTFAPSKWRFAMSLLVIAEMLPTVPGLLGPFVNFYYFGFQFLRFLQFYQSLLYMKHLKLKFFDLYAELVLLVAAALGLLFSTGGFLFIFENKYFNPGGKISTLFEAIYFALITLTTVGYGDFSPVSNLGKIAVCVALLVGFWLIPYHISTSLERYQTWKDSARYKGHGHVIVFSRGAPVMEFIHEFYKKELGLWKAQNMCLMTPEPLNPEERRRLRKPIYEYMISKLKGDIFNEADVKRAGAKKAVACFILSNGISPYMEFLDSGQKTGPITFPRESGLLEIMLTSL
jgi:voltage-gated potassium channel Kch